MISICPGLPLFSLCISHARMPLSPCVKCTPGMSVCSSVYVPIRMCVYQSYSQLCACMCPVAMQRLELAPHHITAHLLSHVGFFCHSCSLVVYTDLVCTLQLTWAALPAIFRNGICLNVTAPQMSVWVMIFLAVLLDCSLFW